MSLVFDKFMQRIREDETARDARQGSGKQLDERTEREIDPNRARIRGREHWMNRTRVGGEGR